VISKPQLLLKLARGGGGFVAVETLDPILHPFFKKTGTQHAKTTIDSMDQNAIVEIYSIIGRLRSLPVTFYTKSAFSSVVLSSSSSSSLFVRLRYMGNTTLQSIPNIMYWSSCHLTDWKRYEVSPTYPPWTFFSSFFSLNSFQAVLSSSPATSTAAPIS